MRTTTIIIALMLTSCQRPGVGPQAVESQPSASTAPGLPSDMTNSSTATEPDAPRPVRPRGPDRGVFSDLDARVEIGYPGWLREEARRVIAVGENFFDVVDGRAVALSSAPGSSIDPGPADLGPADLDGDGIPNTIDILIGAKKTVINNAPYGSPYRELEYPGGDVPREEGVCTDTLVRAVRNAGLDLQKELYEDITRSPTSYPMVKKANPNIDHRRVKTLLPYFRRQWVELPVQLDGDRPWLPGDVIFMNTMGDGRPDHVGIVSDTLGESGAPLIVNNWTDGYHTAEMDIATFVPVTHRFRIPGDVPVVASLETVLQRAGLVLPLQHRQVVLVRVAERDDDSGHLTRFERHGGIFRHVGETVEVTVGAAGLSTGRGLHSVEWKGVGREKREGDRTAPAGIFTLGTAFGTGQKPFDGDWSYREVSDEDVFVDDPESPHYNSWQTSTGDGDDAWMSAERLTMYDVGLVVHHNTGDTQAGHGSAIFLHTWQGDARPTLGCTAMRRDDLVEVLGWLSIDDAPVLVQISD